NQMRLGIMAFATEFRSACGVEIAEAHESHPVSLLVPVAGALKRELRLTIRVCGTRRVRFIDKRLLRFTVYGGCRGKHQAGNPSGAHSLEERQAGHQI